MACSNNRKITRRKFIKGVAGVAVCCACFPLDCLADPEDSKEHLAAPCGTFCGACPAYISKHHEGEINFPSELPDNKYDWFINYMNSYRCDGGCLTAIEHPPHTPYCTIRQCVLSKPNVTRCSDCEELPCNIILSIINEAPGYPHRQEYLSNLAKIKEMGVEEWVTYEEERWKCPQCGGPISWYDTRCAWCGAPRSKALFALVEDESPRRVNLVPILNLLFD